MSDIATSRQGRTVPGWIVWSLRVIVLLVAVLMLLQAVLAGLFVTGDVGMLDAHGTSAGFATALAFLQIIAAILVWRPGHGAVWPIWASVAVFLVIETQAAFGYARQVSAHIPLGVALFGLSVAMVAGVFSPRIRQVRGRPGASR